MKIANWYKLLIAGWFGEGIIGRSEHDGIITIVHGYRFRGCDYIYKKEQFPATGDGE